MQAAALGRADLHSANSALTLSVCQDYGNAETDNNVTIVCLFSMVMTGCMQDDGKGTMEAL